jgi:hypothetical protein
MRGHFRYLRFKTFPMTLRTSQCLLFCPLLSSSEHSGVPEDSKSQLFQVLGFTPTLGQVRVAIVPVCTNSREFGLQNHEPSTWPSSKEPYYPREVVFGTTFWTPFECSMYPISEGHFSHIVFSLWLSGDSTEPWAGILVEELTLEALEMYRQIVGRSRDM